MLRQVKVANFVHYFSVFNFVSALKSPSRLTHISVNYHQWWCVNIANELYSKNQFSMNDGIGYTLIQNVEECKKNYYYTFGHIHYG